MSFPEQLKMELVLRFKYRHVANAWRRDYDEPEVVRLPHHDCRQEYRAPVVIPTQSRSVIEVRIYDDAGIDITNAATLLGDWTGARSRCEQLLAERYQSIIAEADQDADRD